MPRTKVDGPEALAVLMQFLGDDGTRCVAMDPLKA